MNLGFSYAMAFGLMLPLCLVGFYYITTNYDAINLFLLITIGFYGLIWTDMTYGFLIYLPLLTILVSLGFKQMLIIAKTNEKSKSIFYSLIFIVLLISQSIPEVVVVRDTQKEYVIDNDSYDRNTEYSKAYSSGIYLSVIDSDTPIISHTVSNTRIAVYSGTVLPRATELNNDTEYYEFETVDILKFIKGDIDQLYVFEDESFDKNPRYSIFLPQYDWEDLRIKLNLEYIYMGDEYYIVALYAKDPSSIKDDGEEWKKSTFVSTLMEDNYNFYNNGFQTFYYIDYRNS